MEPELERLERRVEELEERLAHVEGLLHVRPVEPAPVPLADPLPPPVRAGATPPPLPPVPFTTATPASPEPDPPRSEPWSGPPPQEPWPIAAQTPAEGLETRAGLAWLNRIGAVTMVLAVAFGFKAAVDNNLIGPAGRILIGLLAGGLTILAGDTLWRRQHRLYAQGITSLGICIFYLTFYAAFQLYHLVPQTVAFAGALVATAAAGALALRYDARAIAILALLGGYLSPFLVSTGQPNDAFFGGYLVVLNAIALTLARRKKWLSVEITAAIGAVLLHTFWIGFRSGEIGPILGGVCLALQYAIFALSPFAAIRLIAPLPAMLGIAVVCSAYSSPAYWPFAALVSAGGLALAWRDRDHRAIATSLAGWILGLVAWRAEWASHSLLFAALSAAFLAYLAAVVVIPAARRTYATYSALILNGLFYYAYCYAHFDKAHHGYMGLLALVVAACYLGVALHWKKSSQDQDLQLTTAGIALSFVTLAIPIQLSGYSITLAWAVECAVLGYVASRFTAIWPFAASWVVGFLAIAVLFGEDAQHAWGKDYSPLFNARFIPFVVVAVCLGLNAYFTQRHRERMAAIPGLAAHFILLTGLHLEVFAWLESGHRPGDNLTSQEAVASTILLALYGLALVAHGITRHFRPHRLLGLAVFALVIAKLYLYDIWQLNWLYKVIAFGGLGALLLSGSYLYSRYRNRLLDLLQDKQPSS